MTFLLKWLVSALSVIITSKVIPGFEVDSFFTAMIAAVVIGLANAIIWPILFIFTLPINIVTLGLFTFVINGAVLKIAAAFLPGFTIVTWGAAILASIVLSLVSMALHYAFV